MVIQWRFRKIELTLFLGRQETRDLLSQVASATAEPCTLSIISEHH